MRNRDFDQKKLFHNPQIFSQAKSDTIESNALRVRNRSQSDLSELQSEKNEEQRPMNNWKLSGRNWYLIWYNISEIEAISKMYAAAENEKGKVQLWQYLNNQWQLKYTLNKT